MTSLANVPPLMKAIPNWIVWRSEYREGKDGKEYPTKIPYVAHRLLERAAVDDPASFCSYRKALDVYELDRREPAFGLSGLGFVFDGNGICGIDLDNAILPDGTFLPEFIPIREAFQETYQELSPSGKGIHILLFCETNPWKNGRSRQWIDEHGIKHEVGFFFAGKFFTMTGNTIGSPNITEYSPEYVRDTLKQWIREEPPKAQAVAAPDLGDRDIIELALDAKNGLKFARLWRGMTDGYPTASEADSALAGILAFWTTDGTQIERIMRSSGLFREKWARADYLQRTIQRAQERSRETYSGRKR